jgi:hypothetical protein
MQKRQHRDCRAFWFAHEWALWYIAVIVTVSFVLMLMGY